METQLVERNGIPFKSIPAAGVHGIGPRTLPRNLWQLGRGVFASRRILLDFEPDVLFFTGGYVAVPMALAGWRVPSLLFVPDIEPGLALKTLARFADKIAVSAEDSVHYFRHPERIRVTGYPTRLELSGWNRQTARQALELDEQSPVLLVFGGSKGARSINQAVMANLPALVDMAQVIHITGELDWPDVSEKAAQLDANLSTRYHASPYLHEQMGAALAAADLVLSRAGASALGEFPLFGLPAILVPYPYAWRYQKVNANFIEEHGAGVTVNDDRLPEQLLSVVKDLLSQPQKLAAMRKAMLRLSHPEASAEIGRHLLSLCPQKELRP